jgi:predicted acylesterase/phospholipase RssA
MVNIQIKQRYSAHHQKAFLIAGGGTRGVYAIGLIKYLLGENPILDFKQVRIMAGTSVGSYFAAALSIGYNLEDIDYFVKNFRMDDMVDPKYLFMVSLFRFLRRGYLYNNQGRRRLIQEIINRRSQYLYEDLGEHVDASTFTLGHLRRLVHKYPDKYRHLIINVFDVSLQEEKFFTTFENNNDDIRLIDILLASSAIPFAFSPVYLYYYQDGYYYQPIGTSNGQLDCLLDGGLSSISPIDYFLINHHEFKDYQLWLLEFSGKSKYTPITGDWSLLEQMGNYLTGGKDDIKMELIHQDYHINTINLHCDQETLHIYTHEEIVRIVDQVYQECLEGKIHIKRDT